MVPAVVKFRVMEFPGPGMELSSKITFSGYSGTGYWSNVLNTIGDHFLNFTKRISTFMCLHISKIREISDTAPLISGTRWDWFLIIITVQHNTGGPDKHNYTIIDNNNKRYKEGKREKKFSGDNGLPDKVHTYPAKTSFFYDQNITLPTPRPYGSLPWPSKPYKITRTYGLKLTVKAIRHV